MNAGAAWSKEYTEVYAWGFDNFGQLGIAAEVGKSYIEPKQCSFNIAIREVSCGNEHAAILTGTAEDTVGEGFVYTMGSNLNGRLGINDTSLSHCSVPCLVEALLPHSVVKVSCGYTHSAAVTGLDTITSHRYGESVYMGRRRVGGAGTRRRVIKAQARRATPPFTEHYRRRLRISPLGLPQL